MITAFQEDLHLLAKATNLWPHPLDHKIPHPHTNTIYIESLPKASVDYTNVGHKPDQ